MASGFSYSVFCVSLGGGSINVKFLGRPKVSPLPSPSPLSLPLSLLSPFPLRKNVWGGMFIQATKICLGGIDCTGTSITTSLQS